MTPPYFYDYLPFEEDLALSLNKLELYSPKDNMYQVYVYSFAITFPWREAIPFISTNFNPHPPPPRMPSLVKIGPVVLEKIFK
jgi:hypothetical protein